MSSPLRPDPRQLIAEGVDAIDPSQGTVSTPFMLAAIASALCDIRDILRRVKPDPDDAPTAALIDAALRVTDALNGVRLANTTGELRAMDIALRRLGEANGALESAARDFLDK